MSLQFLRNSAYKNQIIPIGMIMSVLLISWAWEFLFASDRFVLKPVYIHNDHGYSQDTVEKMQCAYRRRVVLSQKIRRELHRLQQESEDDLFLIEFGWRKDRCHAVIGMTHAYDLEKLKRIWPQYDLDVKKIQQKKSIYYIHLHWDFPSS